VAIGLDTSVVIRLLVGVPDSQARAARRRLEHAIERGESVIVCDLVIAEAYYALQFHYDVPKAEARRMLMRLVRSGVVRVAECVPQVGSGHRFADVAGSFPCRKRWWLEGGDLSHRC